MARPAQGFPIVRDEIRSALCSVALHAAPGTALTGEDDDDDDDEDRAAVPRIARGSRSQAPLARATFGRPEDDVTGDFQIPEDLELNSGGSHPSLRIEPAAWRPLSDDAGDEPGSQPDAEPLLDSLRKARGEPAPGGGQRGLN